MRAGGSRCTGLRLLIGTPDRLPGNDVALLAPLGVLPFSRPWDAKSFDAYLSHRANL
jgi:hypothetical protein